MTRHHHDTATRASGPIQARWMAVATRAGVQHGIVTLDQMRECGFSRSGAAAAARTGRLHRVHHGVYAVGHAALNLEARWQAAILAAGPGAALSHESAALLWQMTRARRTDLHVSSSNKGLRLRGVCTHSTSTLAPDLRSRRGFPVTSPTRTILDLGTVLEDVQLTNVMFEAAFHGLLDVHELRERVGDAAGRRGVATVRRALSAYESGACGCRSGLERWAVRTLRAGGAPQLTAGALVDVGDGFVEVDILFARQRVCVEVDGPGHRRSRTRVEDAIRDARLEAAGFRVVRIDGDEFARDPVRAVRPVFEALRPHIRHRGRRKSTKNRL